MLHSSSFFLGHESFADSTSFVKPGSRGIHVSMKGLAHSLVDAVGEAEV
jgi:hypothetical protein